MQGPQSAIDNDQYKFSMQNAVAKLFPREIVRYEFFNRGKHEFPVGFDKELRELVDMYAGIEVTKEDVDFFREKAYYFDPVYLDLLKGYRFNPAEVKIIQHFDGTLKITVEGLWYRTILWEVPLMALISELYYEMTHQMPKDRKEREQINKEKVIGLARLRIKTAEFGTRRRFSFLNQREFLSDALTYGYTNVGGDIHELISGTSNVYFAREFDITSIGTMAHEWFMFHAAKYGFRMANQLATENWTRVYQGNLGIVLPDTFTTEAFLKSFNVMHAKLYDGSRQDSGSPFEYTDRWVNYYKKARINSITKTIVYSDALNSVKKISDIHEYATGKVMDGYGVGTWYSNDVGVPAMNMVIKMTGVFINGVWVPTIKLSDVDSKNTGEQKTIEICKHDLHIEN